MLQKILLSSLCYTMLGIAGVAQAATWQVLGGSVYVAPDAAASSPAFSATLTPGTPGLLIEGTYQENFYGTSEIFSSVIPVSSGDLNFYSGYTMNFGTPGSVIDSLGTFTPPTSINLATGFADLSSFTIRWFEIGFDSIGATNVPITQNPDGSYHLSWQMQGGFSPTGTATMTMDIAPVPLPAAVWLLGSGLLGLVGIGRRYRKAS